MAFNKKCKECNIDFVSQWSGAKFCSRSCSTKHNLSKYWLGKKRIEQTGEKHPTFNNGIRLMKSTKGYFILTNYYTGKNKALHRYIAEFYLRRRLKKEEIIHHINGETTDNRRENLYLCKNENEHQKIHSQNISCHTNLPTR